MYLAVVRPSGCKIARQSVEDVKNSRLCWLLPQFWPSPRGWFVLGTSLGKGLGIPLEIHAAFWIETRLLGSCVFSCTLRACSMYLILLGERVLSFDHKIWMDYVWATAIIGLLSGSHIFMVNKNQNSCLFCGSCLVNVVQANGDTVKSLLFLFCS